jgi:hypothetical protein
MKYKSPTDCANNQRGYLSHAIAHMGFDNSIVSLSRVKGKAHYDLSQLQHPLQEIREGS